MRSPIHPEGLLITFFLALAALVSSRWSRWLGWFLSILAGFCAFFFRDPERKIPSAEGLIVSPADGTIVGVDEVDHISFLETKAKRVSIFLSIFNVHINRAPIEGKVGYINYHSGAFLPAYECKASEDNEHNTIGIEDNGYKVVVRQIAGIVARRIVCWVEPGASLFRGDRFGLIRFGSRTELYVPITSKIEVKVGQKVQGGATIIGRRE